MNEQQKDRSETVSTNNRRGLEMLLFLVASAVGIYGLGQGLSGLFEPGQDQYADDDRIDVSMEALEYVHSIHLSSACTGGCSTNASCTLCSMRLSRRRGQVSFTRPIWANSTRNATPVTASQMRCIP